MEDHHPQVMDVEAPLDEEQIKKALNYLQQGIVDDMEYAGLDIHHYEAIGGGMSGIEDMISFIVNPPEEQMAGASKEDYQRDILEAIYSHMEDLMDCLNRERLHRILKSDDSDAILNELGFNYMWSHHQLVSELVSEEEEMNRVKENFELRKQHYSKHLF